MESRFDHKAIEPQIYRRWEKSGFFNPDKLPRSHKKPFTIIMPPPNANGALHIGHAVFVTLQDLMIRLQRMRGRKTLWLPGADHAGFETQVVFDKKLEREKRNRFQIPRDKLWQEMWDFTQANRKIMENQLRELGASCDWSRNTFTLDPHIVRTTHETFIQMYKDGLLYRGERIVNWCVKHQTTLSDLEIKYEGRKSKLYFIKYKIHSSNDYIVIATTRPETIPADVAIAVHPNSKWKKFIGKVAVNPSNGGLLDIIADDRVDLNFGTGALKITPYHDSLDFDIYKDHQKEITYSKPISIIRYSIRPTIMTGIPGRLGKLKPIMGLKIEDARKSAAKILKNDFAKKPKDYFPKVPVCYKCSKQLEQRIMPQWFVRMTEAPKGKKALRDMAVETVKSGKIEFIPKRFEKVLLHWMKNLHDWNISRQIVWGIRIPAWYCGGKNHPLQYHQEPIISIGKPKKCNRCDSKSFLQDPDVLDTWFSSGQWPFATLLVPRGSKSKIKNQKSKIDWNNKDYKTFYPTDVMETASDILFFWVARMIMLGIYRTGKIPFRTVYLHGVVRDKDWQKMSKSKGNVIDPLGVAEIYGTDALRIALVIGNMPGSDTAISEDKIRGYRNFTTKIWNASRFVISNYDKKIKVRPKYTKADRAHLKKLQAIKKQVTSDLEKFRFHHAAETLYHYFWHTFADKIIEEAKPRLRSDNLADKATAQALLLQILRESLKMLHPFMPFVTEEIWSKLAKEPASAKASARQSLLMIEKW